MVAARGYAKRKDEDFLAMKWMVWHCAGLSRSSHFPSYTKFVAGNKPKKGIDDAEILGRLMAYQSNRNEEGS